MDTGIKKQVLDEILMAAEKNNIEKVFLDQGPEVIIGKPAILIWRYPAGA